MTILDKHRNKRHIIVIGGGISGLMTALTLARHHSIVHVFDPEVHAESKNLKHQHLLSPDGCHIFNVLYEQIWQELVRDHGLFIRRSDILSHKFPKVEWTNKDNKTQVFSFPTVELKKILLREIQKCSNIKIHQKIVTSLIAETVAVEEKRPLKRVKGIRYPGGEAYADLIIDCRGRFIDKKDETETVVTENLVKTELGETAVTLSREYTIPKLSPTVEYLFHKQWRVNLITLRKNKLQVSFHVEQRSKILPYLLNNGGFENYVSELEEHFPELKQRTDASTIQVSGGLKNIFYRHDTIQGYLPLGDSFIQTHPMYGFGLTSILKQLQVLTSTILAYSDKNDEGIDWIDVKKKIFGSYEMSSYYLMNCMRELNAYWQVVQFFEPLIADSAPMTSNYKKFLFYEKMIPIFNSDPVLYRDFLNVWWALKSPYMFMLRPRLHYDWLKSEFKNLWQN